MPSLITGNSIITCRVSPEHTIISVNEEGCSYFDKKASELQDTNFASLFFKTESERIEEAIATAFLKREVRYFEILRDKNKTQWIIDPIFNKKGALEVFRLTGIASVIRQSKKANDALNELARKQTDILLKKESDRTTFLLNLQTMAQKLSEKELYHYVLDYAVLLTESKIGYLHTVHADQKEIALVAWNDEARKECTSIADNHYPIDKAGMWADCARLKKPVIHNDYQNEVTKKGLPEGHAHIIRHLSLPVVINGLVSMIIGVGNKQSNYTQADVSSVQIIVNELQKILTHKRNEQLLRRISSAVEQSPVLIVITDSQGNIEYANPKFTKVTGYSLDEVIGKNPRFMKSNETSQEEYAILWRSILSGKEWAGTFHNKKKNGDLYWASAHVFPIFSSSGAITHYMAIQEDITAQREAEYVSMLLSQSLKSVRDCVTITDIENKIIFVNKAFSSTYGYTEEEIIGKNISTLRPHGIIDENDRLISPENIEESWLGEIINIKKDGTEFPVEVWASSVKDKMGKVIALVGVARDVSERKRFEDDIILAKENAEEANRLKSIFLANMSHELRTPMIGILGFSEILSELLSEDETLKNYANIINNSGARLLKTLNMILDFSKVQSENIELEFTSIDVVEIIADTVQLFKETARKKNLFMKFEDEMTSWKVMYDERIIRQIVENLINNAINYTETGGITVSVTKEHTDDKDWLGFKVQDTGIGIPKEKQKVIWEPFRQVSEGLDRSYEGTGLGLTLVKNFVNKVDGQIYLESEQGKGSTFYVLLPMKY